MIDICSYPRIHNLPFFFTILFFTIPASLCCRAAGGGGGGRRPMRMHRCTLFNAGECGEQCAQVKRVTLDGSDDAPADDMG